MKIIWIPDTHLKHDKAEAYLSSNKHDLAIFAGDYFDAFNDSTEKNVEAAVWLKKSLENPKRVHLLGNHDLYYLTPFESLRNAGFTDQKYWAITRIINQSDLPKFKIFYWVENILFSHAGFSAGMIDERYTKHILSGETQEDLREFLKEESDACMKILQNPHSLDNHPFIDTIDIPSGQYGPFWMRPYKFMGIPNFMQVIGHTYVKQPTFCYEREKIFNETGDHDDVFSFSLEETGAVLADTNMEYLLEITIEKDSSNFRVVKI